MNRTSLLNAADFINKYQLDDSVVICVHEDCGDDISLQVENNTAYLSIGFHDNGGVDWYAKNKANNKEHLYEGDYNKSSQNIHTMMTLLGLQ